MAGLLDGLLNGNSSGDGSGLLSFLNSLGMGPGMPPADPSASFSDRFGAATPPAFGAPPASIIGAAAAQPASFADRFGAAPAPAFGAGASPMLFANAPGSTPGNPALPSAPLAPPIVAQDDSEDDAPVAASPIGVGGYRMPRVGDASAFTPDPAALPANAQPTQGQLPTSAAPAPDSGGGIGQRIGAALNSLGAPDSLFRNVVSNPVNALISGQTQDESAKNVTARALLAKGVDPSIVAAAIQPGNSELLKSLFTQMATQGSHKQETDKDGNLFDVGPDGKKTVVLAAPKDNFELKTVKDALGNETLVKYNKSTGEVSPASAPGASDAASGAPGLGSLLAQGVKYDPTKVGDDYMAQFSPEVQAAAKSYINGDVMPTGNPRKNSIASFAKTIATKYGQDMGVPVTDATYGAKRTMLNQLAQSSNSSMGGILSNGESSFSHLADSTGDMVDMHNTSHNFPLGGAIAHAQNYVGNKGGGSDTQAKVLSLVDNLGKYGSESTKFYAGTGGGVEERTAARKDVDPNTVSSEEMASFTAKEKSLMLDRLNTKFQEIRNTLGEERGNAEIAKHMPQIQKNIDTIDANIAKLRGEAPAASPAAPTIQNGATATNPKTGQKITFTNGKWQ